jgi:hypothetical protein
LSGSRVTAGGDAVAAATDRVPGLQRRRRRPQHHGQAALRSEHDRQVARRVARALLLLERRIVLLVDHDRRQSGQRRQHRQARSQHDPRAAFGRREPVGGPLGIRHVAVQHRDRLVREALPDASGELGGERDLGHEQQHLRARIGRKAAGEPAEVHLGLAAAGHAMQHHHRVAVDRGDAGERGGLLGGELGQRADARRRGTDGRSGGRARRGGVGGPGGDGRGGRRGRRARGPGGPSAVVPQPRALRRRDAAARRRHGAQQLGHRGQGEFAEARVVVAGAERDQGQPVRRHPRHAGQRRVQVADPRSVQRRGLGARHHQAYPTGSAPGHHHPVAGLRPPAGRDPVVEQLGQRHVQRDAGERRFRHGRLKVVPSNGS